MKKNVVTFIFAAGAFFFSPKMSAQEQSLSFGLRAGTSLSNYRLGGDMKSFKYKMGIGGSVGGFVKYDLNSKFALQSGIDLYYKSSKPESNIGAADKLKTFGIEIPVYGVFRKDLRKGKAFIGAGPYLGYGLSAKFDGVNLYSKSNEAGPAMKRFDYGIGAIIGYDFSEDWQINAGYQLGLSDLNKGSGGSMKSQGLSLRVVYKL